MATKFIKFQLLLSTVNYSINSKNIILHKSYFVKIHFTKRILYARWT